MSESIGEMILPGTYIEVRSEGLIGVGGISTGNVGMVGSAAKGPVGQVRILGSYGEAVDTFGAYDRFSTAAGATPLSLVRALEQAFKGGASTVYAVRIANGTPATATWSVKGPAPGGGGPAPELIVLTAASAGTWANSIVVTLSTDKKTITAVLGKLKEEFTGATVKELAASINSGSTLLTSSAPTLANEGAAPDSVSAGAAGSNGANVAPSDAADGLAVLANQPVNIVAVAGLDANTVGATVLGHLEATENDGRERIAVLGASSDTVATITSADANKVGNMRAILVAPGIVADDAARVGEANKSVGLPASYAAALVAGKLSTLAPHISLTNKDVPADDLTKEYTRAEQKNLLTNRVLVLQKNLGIRVLKGITTDNGAFRQISVRRIVDYAKAGVRIGSNPYIGRLNNSRVRAALKATLDGFLSGMVLDEMLIAYKLDVSATRAQEINGQAIVTMTLQPTFSIDFVKVIMNLE
ncbi:MAG: phage tail sheath subtilisin-like domain-containing protein [Candidatus Solibacter sp.]|nr:phage tail sheath subtilisin-like domain-containing protein [Candidatus Solibacter sp.]